MDFFNNENQVYVIFKIHQFPNAYPEQSHGRARSISQDRGQNTGQKAGIHSGLDVSPFQGRRTESPFIQIVADYYSGHPQVRLNC